MRCLLPAALLCCAACVAPLRGSNRTFAPAEPASLRYPGPAEDALVWLSAVMDKAGYTTQLEYGKDPRRVYLFRGTRGALPVKGGVYWGKKGRAPLWGTKVEVGSVFYVYLQGDTEGGTHLAFYGKPVVAGKDLCDAEDARWGLPCEELEAAEEWDGRRELDGSAEAEVMRGLLTDLALRYPSAAESMLVSTFFVPKGMPAPPPSADGMCGWDYATGSHFQTRVCLGRDKTLQDRYNEDLMNKPTIFTRPGTGGATSFDNSGGP